VFEPEVRTARPGAGRGVKVKKTHVPAFRPSTAFAGQPDALDELLGLPKKAKKKEKKAKKKAKKAKPAKAEKKRYNAEKSGWPAGAVTKAAKKTGARVSGPPPGPDFPVDR
jgi:hypothetical protein